MTIPEPEPMPSLARRTPPVSDYDPDDLGRIDAKIAEFWEKYPTGAYRTQELRFDHETGDVAVKASVWIHRDERDEEPDATGHSLRSYRDHDDPFSFRALETAESVALGRALRFLGLKGDTK